MATTPTRVLVVAHKTAATSALAEAVAVRSAAGQCSITLLVPAAASRPHWAVDPEDQCCAKADAGIAEAEPRLEDAAGPNGDSNVGAHEPVAAGGDALNLPGFDEVIVSTLGTRASRWLRFDLPRRIARLGVPVTTVMPSDALDTLAPAA